MAEQSQSCWLFMSQSRMEWLVLSKSQIIEGEAKERLDMTADKGDSSFSHLRDGNRSFVEGSSDSKCKKEVMTETLNVLRYLRGFMRPLIVSQLGNSGWVLQTNRLGNRSLPRGLAPGSFESAVSPLNCIFPPWRRHQEFSALALLLSHWPILDRSVNRGHCNEAVWISDLTYLQICVLVQTGTYRKFMSAMSVDSAAKAVSALIR